MDKNKKKRRYKPLSELTLMDRFLFDTAMADPLICGNVLSIVLDNPDIQPIRRGLSEKTSEPYFDSRAVRLDLLALDEENAVYDAEAQKKNTGKNNLVRRSRLYQSHIDVNLLPPGSLRFKQLNDVYVIFISPFDLFGKKKYMYTFRMVCDEVSGLRLNDGAVRIFLNTRGENDDEVSPELIEFLHYMEKSSSNDMNIETERVQMLANQIENLKSNQEVGVKYMSLMDHIEEIKNETKIKVKLELIHDYMKRNNVSIEKALDLHGMSVDEYKEYLTILNFDEEY